MLEIRFAGKYEKKNDKKMTEKDKKRTVPI